MSTVIYSMFNERANRSSSILYKHLKNEVKEWDESCVCLTSSDIKQGCTGCKACAKPEGSCTIKDALSKIEHIDAIFIVSPVYFFGLPSQTKAFVDRLYRYDLSNVPIALLLTSGSQFRYGGVDLIIDTFKRIDEYCGSITLTPYNKCTFDEVLPLTVQDKLAVSNIIAEVRGILYGCNET